MVLYGKPHVFFAFYERKFPKSLQSREKTKKNL